MMRGRRPRARHGGGRFWGGCSLSSVARVLGRKSGPPQAIIKRGQQNGVLREHQESHDFWGRQNCSPSRAPITHGMPLFGGSEGYEILHANLYLLVSLV